MQPNQSDSKQATQLNKTSYIILQQQEQHISIAWVQQFYPLITHNFDSDEHNTRAMSLSSEVSYITDIIQVRKLYNNKKLTHNVECS